LSFLPRLTTSSGGSLAHHRYSFQRTSLTPLGPEIRLERGRHSINLLHPPSITSTLGGAVPPCRFSMPLRLPKPLHAPKVSLLLSISVSRSDRSISIFLSPNRTNGSLPVHTKLRRHQSLIPEYWQACLMVKSLGPCGLPIHCALEEPRPSMVSEALCLDFDPN
jgi:hypothetical protein